MSASDNTVTVSQAYDDFILASKANGSKPATLRWYDQRLKPMVEHFKDRLLSSVTPGALRRYIVELRSRKSRYDNSKYRKQCAGGLSVATLHGHFRALRHFFKWCADEYGLDIEPMRGVRFPRLTHDASKRASMDDLNKLLGACGTDVSGLRDRAILLFLADTGCRAGGLLGLRLRDVDLECGRALVTEKGGKSRNVYFSPVTAAALRSWLDVRHSVKYSDRSDGVFVSLGYASAGQSLTLGGVHGVLRRLGGKSGVKGRINPHAWRHLFGVSFINAGGDPASLQKLLGHSDVATTLNFYVNHSEEELQDRHNRFSPVAVL